MKCNFNCKEPTNIWAWCHVFMYEYEWKYKIPKITIMFMLFYLSACWSYSKQKRTNTGNLAKI